jgi:hypothetical protein
MLVVLAIFASACERSAPAAAPSPAPNASVASTVSVALSGSATAASPATPPATDARDARIRARLGNACRLERACGALWGIDCEAAIDGPYYYVKAETLERVSACGGFCRGAECTSCPPSEWACPTYEPSR